jgi:hypothetical protein
MEYFPLGMEEGDERWIRTKSREMASTKLGVFYSMCRGVYVVAMRK